MKKFAAVLLVLVLTLMVASTAMAEQKVFVMTTVTDAEGTVLATITEDGTAVDAQGNDVSDEFPVMCVSIDDEAMTCTFGDENETLNGTIAIVEQTEQGVVIEATLEDEEVLQLVYTVEGVNAVTYVDPETGLMFIMPEVTLEVEG